MNTKREILLALQDLPEDATLEDAMERLYLLYKIERGITQADAGNKVSQGEAKERMQQWLQKVRLHRSSTNACCESRICIGGCSYGQLVA